MSRRILLAGLVTCAIGCQAEVPRPPETAELAQALQAAADPSELSYHPDLQVDFEQLRKLPSGLYLRDLRPGEGDTVGVGQLALARYAGWLPDGTEFDSNRDDAPFPFRVGAGDVITGWDLGLVGMRAGGVRQLVIPWQLGYGETGSGPVPPYATLVFDVELVEIRP